LHSEWNFRWDIIFIYWTKCHKNELHNSCYLQDKCSHIVKHAMVRTCRTSYQKTDISRESSFQNWRDLF
jgi:hypothetical protein